MNSRIRYRETGQESVWDYPRPPGLERSGAQIKVIFNQIVIAETSKAYRVLETSHPPVYYFPTGDVKMDCLKEVTASSWCEWKGQAKYFTVTVRDKTAEKAAWCYPESVSGFRKLKNYLAFYPAKMDSCFVDGEKVQAQQGSFYGGWITKILLGRSREKPAQEAGNLIH